MATPDLTSAQGQVRMAGSELRVGSENLADHPGLTPGQDIIRPLDDPIKKTGHLLMMYGNLCPGGGVAKITGKEGETFTVSDNESEDGNARCSCLEDLAITTER